MNKRNQITAEELAYYQKYGWGGALQGAATGAIAGAALGASVAGPAAPIGAAIGAVGGAFIMGSAGHFAEEATISAEEEQDKAFKTQKGQEEYWGDSANVQSGNWQGSVLAQGGPVQQQPQQPGNNMVQTPPQEFSGQSHQGAQGGIPVDKLGNPASKSGGQPIALVEDGEVSYKGYVFSDKLKGKDKKTFASKAKGIMSKYKKRLGKNFEHDDAMAQEAMGLEMDSIAQENERARMIEQQEQSLVELDQFCKGGRLKKKAGGGMLGRFTDLATKTEASMFGDDLSVSGYMFDGDPAASQEAPMMAYGGGIQIAPTNAALAKSSQIAPRAANPAMEFGNTAGTIGAIGQGVGMLSDAYSMYDRAKQASDESINQTRVNNELWNTQMKHRVEGMGMENPNYAMKRFEGGGNLTKTQIEGINQMTKEEIAEEKALKEKKAQKKKAAKEFQAWALKTAKEAREAPAKKHYQDLAEKEAKTDAKKEKAAFELEEEKMFQDTIADAESFSDTENYRKRIEYESQKNLYGYVPGMTNALRGMIEPAERRNAGDYMTRANATARQYRTDESIKDAQRASYNRLRAYNPSSPTANAAQRIAVDVAQQEQIAKTREQAFNINEQLRGQADAQNRATEARNMQIKMAVDEQNTQNRAAKSNMITTGLEQMVQESQGQMAEDSTNKLIYAMYPQYEDIQVARGTTTPVNQVWDKRHGFVDDSLSGYGEKRRYEKGKKKAAERAKVNERIRANVDAEEKKAAGIKYMEDNPPYYPIGSPYHIFNDPYRDEPDFGSLAAGGSIIGAEEILPETQQVLDYNQQLETQDLSRRDARKARKTVRQSMKADPYFDNYKARDRRTVAKGGVDPLSIIPVGGQTEQQGLDWRSKNNPNITQMHRADVQGVAANPDISIAPVAAPPAIDPNANPIYQKYGEKQMVTAEEQNLDPLDIQVKGPYGGEDFNNWIAARKEQGLEWESFMPKKPKAVVAEEVAEEVAKPGTGEFKGEYDTYNQLTDGNYEEWKASQPYATDVPGQFKDLQPISNPDNWEYAIDLNKLSNNEGRVIDGKWNDNLAKGDKHTMYNDSKSGVGGKDVSWSKDDKKGNPTIGYGHFVTKAELDSGRFDNGLTEMEARQLFEEDSRKHNKELYKEYGWLKDAPSGVRESLEDMAFNMGLTRFRKFAPTLKLIKAGKYKTAAKRIENTPYYTNKTTQRQKDVVANIRNS